MDTMSRKQQTILGILGMAIVLVYGCLGSYGLIRLTQGGSTKAGGSEQAAGLFPWDRSRDATGATTDTLTLPSQAPGGPLPTNTRVIALDGGVSPPPAGTPTSASTGAAPSPAATGQPTSAADAATTPPPPAATPYPPADGPTPRPASPTPETSCVGEENDLHQQKLAEIEAQYEPILTWLEGEMEQAKRHLDDMRQEEVRQEQQLYEQMKAADLNAETQRHEAALAACPS